MVRVSRSGGRFLHTHPICRSISCLGPRPAEIRRKMIRRNAALGEIRRLTRRAAAVTLVANCRIPSTTHEESKPRRRRRWKMAALGCSRLLVAWLFWLNGPGAAVARTQDRIPLSRESRSSRKIHARGQPHRRDFGEGPAPRRLQSPWPASRLKRVTPVYLLKEVVRGRIQGIEIDGLHAELRLGAEDEETDKEEKKPLDLEKLVQTIRSVRGRIIPLSIDLTDISLRATRDGKPVIALAPSSLRHGAGESGHHPESRCHHRCRQDASGRPRSPHRSGTRMTCSFERIDPLPGIERPRSGAEAARKRRPLRGNRTPGG